MTDSNAYINTYIDVILEQLHNCINGDLQLRTQLRILQSINETLNNQILELNKQIEFLNSKDVEGQEFKKELVKTQQALHAASLKASHIDTFSDTIKEMKKTIADQNTTISLLEEKLNSKPSNKQANIPKVPEFKPEPTKKIKDDF